MKKKLLLIISMFLVIFNVKALTFNVDVTNIENEGNNGTMGSITRIDIPNKTLDAEFSDIGDEVSFSITVTNTGDRVGTLRNIDITTGNDKIEYTTNLPENGLAINGNDTNKVIVTAKVKDGAVNGTSTSTIKIKYTYDEGSCPEGEILSEDESMCLCPEGKVRNEVGICTEPPKPIECEEDEIYNEEKKICEKKVVPVDPTDPVDPEPETPDEPSKEDIKPTPITPPNPKTLDNIILITLLFFVSGLGIYAVMFKKLKTNKQRVSAGVTLGVVTFTLSFTVLAGVFGIDNLLGAIINPITKNTEIIVTVNEKIEMLETWDGNCSTNSYAPEDVFEGGSGTESDPYTIKTANQLACFRDSVNDGNTYEGKFVKQIKDIKLNDKLVEGLASGGYGYNDWVPIGNFRYDTYFAGTYDGGNHTISGLLLTDESGRSYKGLFGYAKGATFKNLTLSDTFIETAMSGTGALLGNAAISLTVDNVSTNGKYSENSNIGSGIVGIFTGYQYGQPIAENEFVKIENSTNNISPTYAGIIGRIDLATNAGTDNDNVKAILKNVTNNGNLVLPNRETVVGGIAGAISILNYDQTGNSAGVSGYVIIDNVINNGSIEIGTTSTGYIMAGGISGAINANKTEINDSHNIGNLSSSVALEDGGGLVGYISAYGSLIIDNSYNSGNITSYYLDSYTDGLTEAEVHNIMNDTFDDTKSIGGLVGEIATNQNASNIIKNSYNTGDIKATTHHVSGILANLQTSETNNYSPGWNFTIQDSYNTGDLYVVYGNVAGIASNYGGIISGSHNSGKIVQAGRYTSFTYDYATIAGLLGYGGKDQQLNNNGTVIDSYNEGEILITAKINKVYAAGICTKCRTITDSHNNGNITSLYAATVFEGLYVPDPDEVVTVTNSYNEGTIIPGPGY